MRPRLAGHGLFATWIFLASFIFSFAPTSACAARLGIGVLSEKVSACFGREDPECAEPWIAALEERASASAAVAYMRGYQALLRGQFARAAEVLAEVQKSALVPKSLQRRAQEYRALAQRTANVLATLRPHKLDGGRAVVWVQPGSDEILLSYLDDVLRRALLRLEAALGAAPKAPIVVHIYPRVEDLARVSGLTGAQIKTSGTIALCKYNRVMVTSPADLLFGYAWADTVAHELVHYLITKHGGDRVPVWLHEGLARSFEGVWRGGEPSKLTPDEIHALVAARKRTRFISFSRMSPSMARLPSQEATQLAFAEVHHAVIWMLRRAPVALKSASRVTTVPSPSTLMGEAARRMLARFDAGDDEAQAIEALLGMKRRAFLAAWRHDLKRDAAAMGKVPPSARRARLRFKRSRGKRALPGELGKRARRYVELGDRLLGLERPLGAVIEYRKALARGLDSDVMLQTRLTRALLRLGKLKEANAVLKPALEEHPTHEPLLVLSAEALLAEGKPREALGYSERAAWINPLDPGVHRTARRAWLALGEKDKAAAALLREELVARK